MTKACECVSADYGPVRRQGMTVEGRRHSAPASWLMGRAQVHERDGDTEGPIGPYHAACLDWARGCEQERARKAV